MGKGGRAGVTWVRTGAVALGSLPVFSIHPTVAHMKMSLKDAPEVAARTSPSKACCKLEPAAPSFYHQGFYQQVPTIKLNNSMRSSMTGRLRIGLSAVWTPKYGGVHLSHMSNDAVTFLCSGI